MGRWCKPTLVFIFRPSVKLNKKLKLIVIMGLIVFLMSFAEALKNTVEREEIPVA